MTIDRIALRALVDMLIDRSTSALTVDTIRARLASAVPDLLTELDSLELQLANDRREAQDALERAATRPIGGGAVGGRLAEMETQLETAKHEIQRLTKHNNEIACALGVEWELDAAVAYAAWEARGHAEALASLSDRRDESCSMTVDREELRRHLASSDWTVRVQCLDSIPSLLDALDAADRRIAELGTQVVDLSDAVHIAYNKLEEAQLRLQIATAAMDDICEQASVRIAELESGLRDALAAVQYQTEHDDLYDRLRAILPERR